MKPRRENIVTKQGAILNEEFSFDVDGEPTPFPTGTTVLAQVRRGVGTILLLDLSTHISLGETNGKITLSVPTSVMATLAAGSYKWDLWTIFAGDETAMLEGDFVVEPRISTNP